MWWIISYEFHYIHFLSKFRTKLLAANHLIMWERIKFHTEQKSSKLIPETVTLVSSANRTGSDTEFIPRRVSYAYYEQYRLKNRSPGNSMFQCTTAREKILSSIRWFLLQLSVFCYLNSTWPNFQIVIRFHRNVILLTKFHN